MRAMTKKREQLVDRMVRIAGGERAFESALKEVHKEKRGSPTGRDLLRAVLRKRIALERAKLERVEAEAASI